MSLSRLHVVLFAAGAAVLAFHPLIWLVGTWYKPGYDGLGVLAFALVVALFAWSVSSARVHYGPTNPLPLILLAASALVRLVAQITDVNVVAALVLAVDVYALAMLCRLHERERPIAPVWLAFLFLFSLPLGPILQRLCGYALQWVSAAGACGVLEAIFANVQCTGTRLTIGTRDVLVDLPCSGSELLLQVLVCFGVFAALKRPPLAMAAVGVAWAFVCAYVCNVLRIVLLAASVHRPEWFLDLPMHQDPWHTGLGVVCVFLAVALLALWGERVRPRSDSPSLPVRCVPMQLRPAASGAALPRTVSLRWAGALFFLGAMAIVRIEPEPFDATAPLTLNPLPVLLADESRRDAPLSQQEQRYFRIYGGAARKHVYGPVGVLVVKTGSPLRHLHTPDVCLTAAGYRVRFLRTDFSALPSATYAAIAPDGLEYLVRVTYVSDSGRVAASVAEVVWHWLRAPEERWRMVQRLSPGALPRDSLRDFEGSLATALDVDGYGLKI